MDVSLEEAQLVLRTVQSIPYAFSSCGSPRDLDFIISYLKQAVCLRGISTASQKLFVDLLAPLGGFKAGLLDVGQLQQAVDRACLPMLYYLPHVAKVSVQDNIGGLQ